MPIASPETTDLERRALAHERLLQCERGYRRARDACVSIILPKHAYLTEDSSGTGWTCDRGFEPLGGAGVAIDLPENAYLDRSGNWWSCDLGFQLSEGACILAR